MLDGRMAEHMAEVPSGERLDAARLDALVGGAAGVERLVLPGALVVVSAAGTVVVTEPGEGTGRSGVWSADEIRLLGPAPAPVMERLLGRTWKWSIKGTLLPLHVVTRLEESLVYLGAGGVERA